MRPLEGMRVIDLTHVLAGPFSTHQLCMLGAEVIKIERPGQGDQTRGLALQPRHARSEPRVHVVLERFHPQRDRRRTRSAAPAHPQKPAYALPYGLHELLKTVIKEFYS